MNVVELASEDTHTKERRAAWRRKWTLGAKMRRGMTPDEIEAEEQRLIEEAGIMAAARGLDDSYIGRGWWRSKAIDLQHDGQLSAFRVTGVEAAQ